MFAGILTLLGERNKAVSLNKEAKLSLLFCYQTRAKSVFTSPPLPSMYQSCIFISHSWLHVTLELQPIYFTPGALRGSFQGPIKVCAAKQMWNVIFTGNAAAAVFLHLKTPLCLYSLDSETTEDETTEPQMETKEGGPGRHQDKAGRRGPSGKIQFALLRLTRHIWRFSFFFFL